MLFPRQTPLLVFSNLLLIIIIFTALAPSFFRNKKVQTWRVAIAILCSFLFVLFSFCDTDWFHYQELFTYIKTHTTFHTHIEDVYIYLIKHVCPNFIVFRLIVWGTALLLFIGTLKRFQINLDISFFIFGTSFLPLFAYARVTLAIALLLYGCIVILCPYRRFKYLSVSLGILLVVSSFFFHKSAGIGIATAILCFVWKHSTKNSWFYIILLFALCVTLLYILVPLFVSTSIQEDADFVQSSQDYLSRSYGNKTVGISRYFYLTLERVPYYLTAILCYKLLTNYHIPNNYKFMAQFSFLTVIVATLFVFDYGANTGLFYARVLRFIIIPATITLCYAFQHKLYTNWITAIFITAFSSTLYKLAYGVYNSVLTT